jgi:multidrug efflux pump subunit AcrA (membrane-fusion protein)
MATAALARMRPWRPGRLPPIRGRWLLLLGVVILALIGWFLWTQYTSTQNARPSYQTARVTQGTLRTTIAATGPIANPASVPASFKNAGKLIEVNVAIGDRVVAGQLLARQDTTDLEAQLNQAQAQLDQAEASEQVVKDGPTEEVRNQAEATLQQARVTQESAMKSLEATRNTAASAIASSAAGVTGAQIDLANAQKNLASTIEQRDAALAASQQTVTNAQVALENSRNALEKASADAEASLASAQLDVDNNIKDVAAARASQAAAEQVSEQNGVSDKVSLENARQSLKDAQAQFDAQKASTEKDLVVSRRQRDQQGVATQSAIQARQEACSNGNGNTTACTAAKRSEDQARASLRTAEAQLNSAEASARQTMTQAAASVTNAQSTVRTAEASTNTGTASNIQSNTSARNSVQSAENALKTAMASLASARTQAASSIAQARTSVDQAESTLRTAQKSLESDTVQQNASVLQAQNSVESARAGLLSANATLENTRASQAANVQSAQNTADQQTAALGSAQATYAVNVANKTPAELDQARASTEQQRQAVRTAQNNLDAATLRAPADGTVASISGVVGQWVSGSNTNTNGTSASSTSATAVSSTGATNATGGFITLTDVASLQVTPQVSEADIGRIAPGQGITFTVSAFPGQNFTGQVISIQPVGQTVSNVVVYNVICVVDRTDARLLPAMTATVNIIVEQQDNVILIPTSALSYARTQAAARGAGTGAGAGAGTGASAGAGPVASPTTRGQGQGQGQRRGQQAGGDETAGSPAVVLVLRDGQAEPQPIRIGSSDDQNTVVLSGLNIGDQVITGQNVAAPQSGGTSLFGPRGGPGGGPGGGGPQQKPGGTAPKPGGG